MSPRAARHNIDVVRAEPGSLEAILDGEHGIAASQLDPVEALLLRRVLDLPVAQEGDRGVVAVEDTEDRLVWGGRGGHRGKSSRRGVGVWVTPT